eukprot:CAMPEP_0198249312 /NCGR_PEP_ID=MMETSP1447-20131203/878_1 /TAXON_ID=420782 /ORGANISM="Chaetoceros dichaeta, Strain CCMP1751" /LENGTH=428 /DNA_ID=CAMNT_0043933919 /DNA_START=37 /DNA_END=1323 /DNA_ORIENTATION=+
MSDIDLSHPNAMIRLSSTALRFRCPSIESTKGFTISFVKSFKTVGTHPTTKSVLEQADSSRSYLKTSLATKGSNIPHKKIVGAAQKYVPFINQILFACKMQPENARLDVRLLFEWESGIEKAPRSFKSEAIMYELIMAIATDGLGTAGIACDESINGDFASASRNFKKAAGIMDFLATDQLPQWISKADLDENTLPSEITLGTTEALKILFLANAQQMAVATTLVKPGVPKYSLLAKLSLGIKEQLEMFVQTMRSRAATQKSRMDPDFFTLMTFQIELNNSLCDYFLARNHWDSGQYGLAISFLCSSKAMLRTRDSPLGKGLPEISSKSPLKAIEADLNELKSHMNILLTSWEKDNSKIYFDKVPLSVPADKKLSAGLQMMKPEEYKLDDVEPIPLIVAADEGGPVIPSTEESDHEMALRLQEQLNTN